jgi:hypothetical protein
MLEMMTPYLVLFLGTVLIPTAGFLVRTAFTVKQRLDIHEATDAVVFKGITAALSDLKEGQGRQDEKLDRLIERAHR